MIANRPKAALITGASSGIGAVYARALAKQGQRELILVARRAERLAALAEEIESILTQRPTYAELKVHVIPCDISERENRRQLIAEVDSLGVEVDYLINNAGFGSLGRFLKSDLDWEEAMVRLNCIAPLELCYHYLPLMTRARRGVIINVASVAAYQPMPFMATYGATKAFLLSLSVSLASEVKDCGVTILAQCPGPTKSEFFKVVGLTERMKYLPGMSAEQVVTEALDAAEKGKTIIVHGWINWLGTLLAKILPRTTAASLIGLFLRKHT